MTAVLIALTYFDLQALVKTFELQIISKVEKGFLFLKKWFNQKTTVFP